MRSERSKEATIVKLRHILFFLVLGVGSWILSKAVCSGEPIPEVPYVPTPQEVVVEMLRMAGVTPDDIVYDLGCGDGRIVITAAKLFGARGVGVDNDPNLIRQSNENARKAGVTDRVRFIEQDLFETDIREATVVALYLLPELNLQLRPKLFRDLKPGSRIVTHEFDMGDWKPDDMAKVPKVKLYYHPRVAHEKDTFFYYWVIPANAEGIWRWTLSTPSGDQDYTVRLFQKFQEIRGTVYGKGREVPIVAAHLVGDQLSFTLREDTDQEETVMSFNGRIHEDRITGHVEIRGGASAGNYAWTAKRETFSSSLTRKASKLSVPPPRFSVTAGSMLY
jgi:SAM-dependent methyltransferase